MKAIWNAARGGVREGLGPRLGSAWPTKKSDFTYQTFFSCGAREGLGPRLHKTKFSPHSSPQSSPWPESSFYSISKKAEPQKKENREEAATQNIENNYSIPSTLFN